MNELFQLNIPLDRLMEIGKGLGADVPFCLLGGTALAEGIGEKLTPLPPHPACYVVLACPGIHVPTAGIFRKLSGLGDGRACEKFMKAYESKNITEIANDFYNIFTLITTAQHPEITALITELKFHGAISASMTGTGSTVFGYFENEEAARAACDNINVKTILTKIN